VSEKVLARQQSLYTDEKSRVSRNKEENNRKVKMKNEGTV